MVETQARKEPRQCSEVREPPRSTSQAGGTARGRIPEEFCKEELLEACRRSKELRVGKGGKQRDVKVAPSGICGLWVIRDVQGSS